MLVTVLVLSSTMVVATAIAGLAMRQQIRNAAEAVNSAESIFAAESGLEHQLSLSYGSEECGTPTEEATFSNGARYEATCEVEIDSVLQEKRFEIRSQGSSGDAARALQVGFTVKIPQPIP